MKSIFKKSLVAAAVLSVASVNAATIVTNNHGTTAKPVADKISAEGYAALGYIHIDNTAADEISVSVKPGIDYQTSDLMNLTVAGATIANKTASGIQLVESGTNVVFPAIGVDVATGKVTFRAPTGDNFVAANTYAVKGVKLTGVGATVTAKAEGELSSGTAFDQAASVTTVATMATQFGAKVSSTVKFDRTIDVENERKQFVAVGTDVKTDGVSYDLTNKANLLKATVSTAQIKLIGKDLDFLKDKDGKLASASYNLTGATEDTSATKKATLDGNTLTINSSNAPTTAIGVGVVADTKADKNAQVLTAQSFTNDIMVNFAYQHNGATKTHGSTTGAVNFTGLAAGSWKLSGATVNIPFMPYGSGLTQIIYVSNDGKVDGDIELTAFGADGMTYGPVKLSVSAAANSTTSLAAPIRTALEEAGATGTQRLDLTLVINAPKADVDVFAAYNSRGDRVAVSVNKS